MARVYWSRMEDPTNWDPDPTFKSIPINSPEAEFILARKDLAAPHADLDLIAALRERDR